MDDDLVTVPTRPTEEMLHAAKKEAGDHSSWEDWMYFEADDVVSIYQAMLTAAPEARSEAEDCPQCDGTGSEFVGGVCRICDGTGTARLREGEE